MDIIKNLNEKPKIGNIVNKEGKRFTNDLATRDAVSQAELKQPDAYAYIVYDSKYAEEKLYQKYVQDAKKYIKTAMDDLRPMIQDLKYNRNVPGDEDRARGALTKLSDTIEWYKAMIKSEWGSSPLYNSFIKEVNKAVWETDNANENCIQALIKTLGMNYLQYVRRGTDE
mgnify:CR=1 FL=1